MARKRKKLSLIGFILLAAILGFAYYAFRLVYGPMLDITKDSRSFYIKTGWNESDVFDALDKQGILKKPDALKMVMLRKNYQGSLVVPGKYTLKNGMNANELVNMLRAGNGEEEVQVTFNLARTAPELAGKVARNIEADSVSILDQLTDPEIAGRYGFEAATFLGMFLPDTYRTEWDMDAEEFIARMADEYKKFWTDPRQQRAANLGLSQSQVSTLASVVQAEQQMHPEERPVIAGLYLNRLKRGMRLQSDPTVIYALGDFSINRVLTTHLSTVSPYNTYLISGLPPGPINLPSKRSIDAVLFADENKYIYMCAKADFSGYHAFAETLGEHNRNARAFRNALDKRKIYR